jgi:hypothetical protein
MSLREYEINTRAFDGVELSGFEASGVIVRASKKGG